MFLLLGALVMLLAVNLQKRFNPPPANDGNEVAQLDDADQDQNETGESNDIAADSGLVENGDSVEGDSGDGENTADDVAPGIGADGGQEDAAEENTKPAVDEFYQLGSLDPATGFRFLVTLNSKGATVRRVELNALNHRGRLKYRDLDHKGGYAGALECEDTPDGCRVLVVGNGTPADLTGMRADDVIVAVGSNPVMSRPELDQQLSLLKPGQTVQFTVYRDGRQLDLPVVLTDKPIEVLSKETAVFDPGFDFQESFLFTLRTHKTPLGKDWLELDEKLRTANWEAKESTDMVNGVERQVLEFRHTLDVDKKMQDDFGLPGRLTVIKRYSLNQLSPETVENQDSRSWHIGLDIEIKNESDKPGQVAWQLDGPTGLPIEGWWYQIKIHGGGSLFKSAAGARDVVASSKGKPFVFVGGPEIIKNSLQTLPEIMWIFTPQSGTETDVNYIGVDAQYFNAAIIPRDTTGGEPAEGDRQGPATIDLYSAMAWHTADQNKVPKKVKDQKVIDVTSKMFKVVDLPAGGSYKQDFDIFCGPKQPDLLDEYGLSETRSFGWFGFVSKPLCWLLHKLYWITFKISYAIPIIILTVLVRLMMVPFSRKAALNAQMMQHLAPQMKEIKEKHKDDMEKSSQAQRELFKKHNYNPLSGCLIMFFQLPIFLGLYRGLSVDIALRDQPLIPGVQWCSNLSAPDQFMNWQSWMPLWLAGETGWLGPYLNILPLITMVLFLVQQKMFTPPATDDQQKMMQKMMSFMMLFMGILFFKVPAGLCLYFITSSLWGIIERKLLPKPVLDKTQFDEGENDSGTPAFAGGPGNGEALSNDQQLADRKRRDKERRKKLRDRS